MRIEPAFEGFKAAYAAGKPQVVWTRLVADLETPVSAYLKLASGRANTFLLESVEGGAVRGRYSMRYRFRGQRRDVSIVDRTQKRVWIKALL